MKLADIRTVAIVGAGTMGQGIAQVCGQAGFTVLLFDVNRELSEQAIGKIRKSLDAAVEKGKLAPGEVANVMGRIRVVTALNDLVCDLAIEAVVEKLEIKQKLFAEIEAVNKSKAILATNTSSISVTRIAANLKDPTLCAGLHFFNPAHLMKLVEVISGASTAPWVVALLREFSERVGKIAVTVKDSPGFIVNRVARHFYVESLKILEENVASFETVDQLMKSSGFRMGPFELMDLIGMDTNFAVTSSVYDGFHQDSKFRPSRIQEQKVAAGHLGRKSGKGFYDYQK